jgi:hypothetical protein
MTRVVDIATAALARRLEAITLAASVLDNDDLHARLTEPERVAIAVLAREVGQVMDEIEGRSASVLPFRRRP